MIGEAPNRLGLTVQLSLADERQASAQEGAKDRACALVSPTVKEAGRWIVVVVSITRGRPMDAAAAIDFGGNQRPPRA
jgi:mRNA-degrading endonuclease toxin of MazEF toxin-antitoxin module